MATRIPGPADQFQHPQNIQDGTLARQPSLPPGTMGINAPNFSGKGGYTPTKHNPKQQSTPAWANHTHLAFAKRLYNEKWFEERFPNTLKVAHLHFAEIIYSWAIDPVNKGETKFEDNGRNKAKKTRVNILPEYVFDKRQSEYESTMLLGKFAIDLETPIKIERNIMNGIHGIKWKGIMYVEDIVGDSDWGWIVPKDTKCIRGKWEIETDMTKMSKPIMQFRTWNNKIMKWPLDKPGPSSPYLTSPIVKERYFPSNEF